MWPDAMRLAPSHSTATLETLITKLTVGNIDDISRPATNEVSVNSALPRGEARRSPPAPARTPAPPGCR